MRLVVFAAVILSLLYISNANSDYAKNLAGLLAHLARKEDLYHGPIHVEDYSKVHLPTGVYDEKAQRVGESNPLVDTTSGEVEGISTALAHSFYQIPYAEPPVGELRFQPPIPLQTPRKIDATNGNGRRCHQFEGPNCIITPIGCGRNMDEDCLLLNVYVPIHVNLSDPSERPHDTLPVLFYIHGGSFNSGSGTGTDGRELANVTNTVVVTINYRLGPLGFLVHKEVGKLDIEGNQGLKDQQLALKWVQDNIPNFGGNKYEVTIFGGSAGAQSVMFHTLSKVSEPLYVRAIQQSNPAYISFQTPEESLQITEYVTDRLCNVSIETERECLMNADPLDLVNREVPVVIRSLIAGDIMGMSEPYRPVIDGVEFTDQPMSLYRDGKWNSYKSMIMGVNTQELDDIPYFVPDPVPTGKALFTIVNYYILGPGDTDAVVKKYEEAFPPEGDDYAPTFGKEMSHLYFICPSRAMARFAAFTAKGDSKVYFYANEHPILDGNCKAKNNGSEEGCYLASHGDEMRFVFRSTGNPTDDDQSVENQFSTYWGSFARTGEPSNGLENSLGDFPDWPQYSSPSMAKWKYTRNNFQAMIHAFDKVTTNHDWESLRIKAPEGKIETGYEQDICDFWDSIGFYMDPIPLPTTTATVVTEDDAGRTDPPIFTTSNARSDSQHSFIFIFSCLLPILWLNLYVQEE
uniref:acetylcholinesterase-like n=1 Tax=Styela clava TaxID=7725 RepID=UPI001939415E|nr:acetylcholinesterase-like [Styela clava]